MLYIVSGELIPESNKLYKGRMSAVRKHVGIYNRIICDDVIASKDNSII